MNQVRIIGGRWRGRKIEFPDVEGLRPTPDRLRETLFNWLAPLLPNARCLDLFAGSGALGFEALSRGAAHTVFVERDKLVCRALKSQAATFQTKDVEIVNEDALQYLTRNQQTFDIIFLDPPFHTGLFAKSLAQLQRYPCWSSSAWLYCEIEREIAWPSMPDNWSIWREKNTKEIQCQLVNLKKLTT